MYAVCCPSALLLDHVLYAGCLAAFAHSLGPAHTAPVDHYKRKAVRYYEEATPPANEIRVTSAGRTTDWVRKATAVLEVQWKGNA